MGNKAYNGVSNGIRVLMRAVASRRALYNTPAIHTLELDSY